jgi:hypothetical protein
VLEHLAQITAIDPAATGRTADEMLGLTLRRVAEKLPNIFAAWNGNHFLPRFLATGRRRGLRGFSSSIASLVHMLASFRNVAVVSVFDLCRQTHALEGVRVTFLSTGHRSFAKRPHVVSRTYIAARSRLTS